MPIWSHLVLVMLADLVGWFGGAIAGFYTLFLITVVLVNLPYLFPLVGVVSFLGGAILGLRVAHRSVTRYLPARCPECRGHTYFRPGNPITYWCRACRHVHFTRVSGGMGGYRGLTAKRKK
jgi:hypothetical protein